MCEINPKQTLVMRLEVYTSNPHITREEFLDEVSQRLLAAEIKLNEDGQFRFHIHEMEGKDA